MDNKLTQSFSKQINNEFYSAYLYFAMSTYFEEIAMQGFSSFMRHKAGEKLHCAQKIYDYIILRDEKLTLYKIDEPTMDWINATDIFSSALTHEENMLNNINELYKVAYETDDVASMEFISTLLNDEVKCVGCFRKLVFRIKNSNVISSNVEILNQQFDELMN